MGQQWGACISGLSDPPIPIGCFQEGEPFSAFKPRLHRCSDANTHRAPLRRCKTRPANHPAKHCGALRGRSASSKATLRCTACSELVALCTLRGFAAQWLLHGFSARCCPILLQAAWFCSTRQPHSAARCMVVLHTARFCCMLHGFAARCSPTLQRIGCCMVLLHAAAPFCCTLHGCAAHREVSLHTDCTQHLPSPPPPSPILLNSGLGPPPSPPHRTPPAQSSASD